MVWLKTVFIPIKFTSPLISESSVCVCVCTFLWVHMYKDVGAWGLCIYESYRIILCQTSNTIHIYCWDSIFHWSETHKVEWSGSLRDLSIWITGTVNTQHYALNFYVASENSTRSLILVQQSHYQLFYPQLFNYFLN